LVKNRFLALMVVLVLIATLVVGCGESKTVKIGAIQPISGGVSEFGTQTRDAMQIAVDEYNKQGGVLGKQIELIVEDDENNPDKTVNAFNKLVTKDKVVGILGGLTSKVTLAITSLAQNKGIPLLTPTATNVSVTDAGDCIFRACFLDDFQGNVMAKFATATLKAKKAALLYDFSNDYSKGLAQSFKDNFVKYGGQNVAEESYNANETDFSAQLTKIKNTNPDVLFLPDYYNTVGLIGKQAKNMGIKAVMMGGDGWDSVDTDKDAATALEGSYFSNHYSPNSQDPNVKAFVDSFKAKNGKTPNALAALGYDAVKIMVEAIKSANSTDPAKIKEALKKTDVQFVTGKITFNEKRNPMKPAYIIKVTGGKLVDAGIVKYEDVQ
jgi:branched-chain amino acid transport system substrate-binding protein